MEWHTIQIPILAENEMDAQETQAAFRKFVEERRSEGIAVTAKKIRNALNKFGNNIFLKNFLR